MRNIVFLLLTCAGVVHAEPLLDPARRPLLWSVSSRSLMPATSRKALGARFGATPTAVTNMLINAGGLGLRLNHIECEDDAAAATLHAALAKFKGDATYVLRRERVVIEFVCSNRLVVQRARHWVGWSKPDDVVWKVTMDIAPLASAPPMQWNPLFNALLRWRADRSDAAAQRVRTLAAQFRFAETVALRDEANPWGKPQYRLQGTQPLQRTHGVPTLAVHATVPVRGFVARGLATPPDRALLCGATEFWPVADPVVVRAVREALPGRKKRTPHARIAGLLRWLHQHVRYAGQQSGTRYGVARVLAQGHGHCWDKSDVLITMLRASGIPARQIGGWIDGVSGHIWCDVWIDGEGWMELDATASWLGTSSDYVPLWVTQTGEPPFVYWQQPRLQRMSAKPVK